MKPQSYTPPKKVLEKYAELIVLFGLQTKNGKKLKKGSVIRFTVPEVARPLYYHLQAAILKHGYHPIGSYLPCDDEELNFSENFFKHASKAQLDFAPKQALKQIDATVRILAETNPHALRSIDPEKIMRKTEAQKKAKDQMFKKVNEGKLTWTLALYGTDASAKEAGMTLKEFWNQIIKACYLDAADPVKEWFQIEKTVRKTADKLTKMKIDSLKVTGPDIDLEIGIGHNRAWKAGGGNNIPSFEVFTSPDWRRVNGWARFNQPHYRYGKKIEGIGLWFKDGVVVKSKAAANHDLLKKMLAAPGGNKIGEFSLTDSRLSRITKFMAETLFDENMGGKYGNTHVALGSAYRDCFVGDMTGMSDDDWTKMGYNDSSIHSDIISTTKRTVTAKLSDGTSKVIYDNGQFTI